MPSYSDLNGLTATGAQPREAAGDSRTDVVAIGAAAITWSASAWSTGSSGGSPYKQKPGAVLPAAGWAGAERVPNVAATRSSRPT
jgi:hypothetical protein